MRKIDLRTATDEEYAAWGAEFDAAIEDGSLRAEIEAEIDAEGGPESDPEWKAKYGDDAWDTALIVSGYCAPWDPILTHPSPRPKEFPPKG